MPKKVTFFYRFTAIAIKKMNVYGGEIMEKYAKVIKTSQPHNLTTS